MHTTTPNTEQCPDWCTEKFAHPFDYAANGSDCGLALRTIRDDRLYRETHSSFEAYCAERWDMARRDADRFIEAASLTVQIGEISPESPLPENAGQARELSGLEPEQAADVMRETAERTNGKPTGAGPAI